MRLVEREPARPSAYYGVDDGAGRLLFTRLVVGDRLIENDLGPAAVMVASLTEAHR
jgi:hypothetical protein